MYNLYACHLDSAWVVSFVCGGVCLCAYVGLCASVCLPEEARGLLASSPPYFRDSLTLSQFNWASQLWGSIHLSPLSQHWAYR